MLKKANRRLFMLGPLKRFGFDQEELEVVYICYVRPVLEYGDVVLHSGLCTKQTADLERIQRRACRTILGHQFKSYRDAVGKCNLEYLKDRRETHCKKFAQGLGDNARTCISYPLQDFSLMVEIWEIHQICPSTAWKPVASETALCLTLFRFWTKHWSLFQNGCLIYSLNIVFSIHSQWVSCTCTLELNSINLHTGWVGVWGWALCILGLGRGVCMRVWDYVQGCQVVMYICAITTFVCVLMCPCWQGLFQFS